MTDRTLVVGASRGVGRATATLLAKRGHRVAIGYCSNRAAAEELQSELRGAPTVLVQGDIATDAAQLVAGAVDGLGGLDNIVVTAVPVITGPLSTVTREQAERAMAVCVHGFREIVLAAQERLVGGAVVGVSSLGSDRYAGYYGALGPAKAAFEGLVRYLAAELGPRGIRVNAVSPCLIDDPQHFEDAPDVARFLDAVARRTPLGHRLGTPGDVAAAIAALLGDDFRFVTGQILKVDGGYSLLA